ncbi:MAG TPA: hypothetical protein VE985_11235 [Gaiellaceae bacterium]|nr:hypothetical protein [Gaiellaceae bacterium]
MTTESISLERVGFPKIDAPRERPALDGDEYRRRMRLLLDAAGANAVVVYGDREHCANLVYCCGFDPRFEEALLVLTSSSASLIVGNEGLDYAKLLPVELEVILAPSLSLLGQSRSEGHTLVEALAMAGLKPHASVGIVGWKYFTSEEMPVSDPPLAVPSFVLVAVKAATHGGDVHDATPVVMGPETGLRASNSADELALFEWGAARASAAVARVIAAASPGTSEEEAVASAGYAGEPLTAHVMFASGSGLVGLRSPTERLLRDGDAVTTAIGYWGGLCSRAGVLASRNGGDAFERDLARPYWRAIASWYEAVGIGVRGGDIDAEIRSILNGGRIRPALNPGHLTGVDEWIHSPIRPESSDLLRSGMALQCDIIPVGGDPAWASNCEDTIALADDALRAELRRCHPAVWTRIEERKRFMRDTLGIRLRDDILPLSGTNAYFPPYWLSPDLAFVKA